jgi:hypothetical protein
MERCKDVKGRRIVSPEKTRWGEMWRSMTLSYTEYPPFFLPLSLGGRPLIHRIVLILIT